MGAGAAVGPDFVALVAQLGDPSALITALIVVGMLALVFSVP
jgi:hypothetical protein